MPELFSVFSRFLVSRDWATLPTWKEFGSVVCMAIMLTPVWYTIWFIGDLIFG